MKLTREQAIAEHRKIWNWIADATGKRGKKCDKGDYIGSYGKARPSYCCFCCEYAMQIQKQMQKSMQINTDRCHWCPIDWGSSMQTLQCQNYNTYSDYNGIFGLWARCQDTEEAARLARQIANLSERTDNVPVFENT